MTARQPIHTVYGGAHLFRADLASRFGARALAFMDEHAPDAAAFGEAFALGSLAGPVYDRVREKLTREPVEDFRIDFEDGYGSRPDDEEDATATTAAAEVATGFREGSLPPWIGIRIKPLSGATADRATRTLELFLRELAVRTEGNLPDNFIVTLPKVTTPDEVRALVRLLEHHESGLGFGKGALCLELMVETPQSIVAPDGSCPLPAMVAAAEGRCRGAHFGVYDYTAACNITAAYQLLRHPACDHARNVMQTALAGADVQLSDGATNVIPVPPRERVLAAWQLHAGDVRHSLLNAFYQGWDLHPAHLPSRYATVFQFFLEALGPATERLSGFIAQAAQASLVGTVFDDAATGQGLLNYFLRALNCGAIGAAEVEAAGISVAELRGRSFPDIVAARRG